MNYKYKCGDEKIKVWVWGDNYHKSVTITDRRKDESIEEVIREDEKGQFFMYNSHKIYLNDWIRISMLELKEKVEHTGFITSDELCQAILTDGIDRARFIVPFKTKSNNFKDVLCKVEERYNREVKENYKLVLVPVEPDNSVSKYEEFYTMDMTSLIEKGIIKISV